MLKDLLENVSLLENIYKMSIAVLLLCSSLTIKKIEQALYFLACIYLFYLDANSSLLLNKQIKQNRVFIKLHKLNIIFFKASN
ncbi:MULTISPECIES: hypothetical protein [Bacillus]|jgi:hypothetical protein|uniref:Uncharacterized protein n=1 Tax=Bacillus cereus VD184 TaxID=1053242 RepID=A0A9W5VTH1_BACCE|nr:MULTISPECIES: hypothetical protein [Bacillus]EOQ16462.1 hypothetical protein IKC_04385 [Bacillus cereus VD184]KAB7681946.1 hypothetical protein GBN91_06670 [Bacillus sp. B1-WWTP-T-0.5-Post-4]QEL68168.1 hypothetical protein DN399_08840 [Bacillus sp. AR4-2]QEL73446.1 hypothetical protein DN405_08845 [Bacillus sp. SH8-8]HCX48789.1 hypothetical protein [Bacillus sp. (in: firmicutes)]